MTWASKMQTEMALSTTEAELIAMSEGLRTTIPLMNLLEGLADQGLHMIKKTAGVHCRVFKDNSGDLTIATLPKIRPCTKHVNNKYWNFRECVEQGKITIHTVTTQQQIADLLSKPLAEREFTAMKSKIMGDGSNSGNPHLPGSVRICEEHEIMNGTKRINDKNQIIAMLDKTKSSNVKNTEKLMEQKE